MKYLGAEVPKCDSSEDQPKEKERNPEDFGAKNFQLKNGTHSRETLEGAILSWFG